MKKYLSLFLVAIIGIFMTACDAKKDNITKDDNRISIVSTIFPGYDFAKQIAGEKANVELLLPPGAESHSYEPSPQDIIKIQNADLFIYVGGESDEWVEKILNSMDTKINVIKMMDVVDVYEEELVEGMQEEHDHNTEDHDHDAEEHEHEYDEHVWTSIKNSIKIVDAIGDKLENIDSTNKEYYSKNKNDYEEKLSILDTKFTDLFNNANSKTLIFGDRFPFRYFVEDYKLNYYAAFPGCSSETEPSTATVAFLIDKVKEESINTIFYIEFSNHNIADTIAESTNAKTAMLHSCHNVSLEDIENNASYYSIMENNYNTLKGALN